MKILDMLLVPVFLFVMGVFVLASRAPEPAPTALQPQLVGQNDEETRQVGVVVDWRMMKDGTVYLLFEQSGAPGEDAPGDAGEARPGETIAAREEGEFMRRWFKTPPIQGQQVHFQDLVLILVLQAQRQGSTLMPLSLWGEPTPTTRGRSMDDAITITMIGAG